VCAAIGVWSGFADRASFGGHIVIPTVWLTLTAVLLSHRRVAVRDGFEAGVARAYVDPVTRLPSPAIAKRLLDIEFAAAERGRPLTVVFFSIDDFARLSASKGPEETKKLLVGAGVVLKKRTRGMNVSARYDERGTFISVLGSISSEGAATFAAKVCKDLRVLRFGQEPLKISSIVCAYDPVMQSADELLTKAQHALSETRQRGGDKLVVDGKREIGEREGYAIM
jgi:diguanylate cyclase (GGDEF)-like protein